MKEKQEPRIDNAIGARVEYVTPRRRVHATAIVLGLGAIVTMSITVIVLALIFKQAVLPIVFWTLTTTGAIVVITVLVIAATRVNRAIQDHKTANQFQVLAIRREQAETRQVELQNARLEVELPLLKSGKNEWIYDMRTGRRIASPHELVKDVAMLAESTSEPQPPNLLDIINQADCLMVQGGRGSGKTNIMLHWLASKRGYKVVLDPKGLDLNPWPGAYVAQDSASMLVAVNRVLAELKRRKGKGLTRETDIYLAVDELHHLVEESNLPIMEPVFYIVTFGREFNCHASFTCSDGGVKSLDIEGRSGLREGLVRVQLTYSLLDKQYRGWILDAGDKPNQQPNPVTLPGAYRPTGQPSRVFVSGTKVPKPTGIERRVLDLHGTMSLRQLTQEIWGEGCFGKHYNDQVYKILAKNGVSE